jgi:hypothetical protein
MGLRNSQPLETCDSLREAITSIKERLNKIDKENEKQWNWYKVHMPEYAEGTSYIDKYWNDNLYLVYDKDEDEFYIFEDEYNIDEWLEKQWDNGLYEYDTHIDDYFENDLRIWEFHRDICKEKWDTLYKDSKPFIKGWMRLKKTASMEYEPRFSI